VNCTVSGAVPDVIFAVKTAIGCGRATLESSITIPIVAAETGRNNRKTSSTVQETLCVKFFNTSLIKIGKILCFALMPCHPLLFH